MSSLRATISDVSRHDIVECRIDDGTLVLGECAAIERDQSGLRVVLSPVDASPWPHRICVTRTMVGWREPYLDRWEEDSDGWERYGRVVDVEIVE